MAELLSNADFVTGCFCGGLFAVNALMAFLVIDSVCANRQQKNESEHV